MKTTARILGIILMIIGTIWILQGVNILPGSFMTGQTKWAINGAIAVVIGVVLFAWSRRMGTG